MKEWKLKLPYPPSINNYYKRALTGVYLSKKASNFREEVRLTYLVSRQKSFGDKKISMAVDLYPPDKQIRDIDNVLKGLLDAMQYATIYENDSQIKRLEINIMPPEKEGFCIVTINSL